jgi:hypothetical protein
MLDISSSLAAHHFAGHMYRVQPAVSPAKSVIKTGAVVILSPAARRLSQELQALDADEQHDPQSREEALERLRKLAAHVREAGEQGL